MTPLQVLFFEALDKELAKVQSFYREREKDALIRSALIKEQLNELKDHRRIFHVSTGNSLTNQRLILSLTQAYEDQQTGVIFPKAIGKLAAHFSPPRFGWKAGNGDNNEDITGPGLAQSTSRPGLSRQASPQPRFDPDEYQDAKKKLKKAVLEFYRWVAACHLIDVY